jgi:hypothetical protein
MKINFTDIKQKTIKWFDKLSKKSWFAKTICFLLIWTVAFIPLDFYFLFRWILEPTGFWEHIVLLVVWGILLGWVQIIAGILGFVLTIHLLDETF